ncbi:hypothetical protein HED51_24430 [Ochrobactrum grignonense]|nr:hypothetical protein [Brucella grignonensis]
MAVEHAEHLPATGNTLVDLYGLEKRGSLAGSFSLVGLERGASSGIAIIFSPS